MSASAGHSRRLHAMAAVQMRMWSGNWRGASGQPYTETESEQGRASDLDKKTEKVVAWLLWRGHMWPCAVFELGGVSLGVHLSMTV